MTYFWFFMAGVIFGMGALFFVFWVASLEERHIARENFPPPGERG